MLSRLKASGLVFLLATFIALAGAASASTTLTTQVAYQDDDSHYQDNKQQDVALQVHDSMRLKRKETSQATLHWKTTTSRAQRPPNSRRTVAMAATQGV